MSEENVEAASHWLLENNWRELPEEDEQDEEQGSADEQDHTEAQQSHISVLNRDVDSDNEEGFDDEDEDEVFFKRK